MVQGLGGVTSVSRGVTLNNIGGESIRNFRPEKRYRSKLTVNVWKPKKARRKLVMGMHIGLEESCNLALCALVGRLAYQSRCSSTIDEWVQRFWKPLLGYTPEILSLSRGWMGFMFKNPKDSETVISKFWSFDGGSLMIKMWRLSFNPETEYFSFRHMWVLLPSLPLQLWNLKLWRLLGTPSIVFYV
jgi:hypothetical protein